MNIAKTGKALVLTLCVACAALADDTAVDRSVSGAKAAATEKINEIRHLKPSTRTKSDDSSSSSSTTTSEVSTDVSISSGYAVALDSSLDYSSASTVAVSVMCSSCTTSTTSLGTLGLTLQARWMVTDADSWVATESKSASNLTFWDSGGTVFNVYGEQFRLILKNTGSSTITLTQVMIFKHSN